MASYVGLAPTSVWIWRPTAIQVQEVYHTLVSEFETGAEQRRGKWVRPLIKATLRYDRPALTVEDLADIWRFYRKQQGSLRTFDLPLFGKLTAVTSLSTVGSTSLWLDDTQDLSSSATSRWSKLYLQNAAGNYDVFTVTSVTGATRIEVQSSTGNVYQVGDPVAPVINARFADDLHGPEYLPAYLANYGVSFLEVRT